MLEVTGSRLKVASWSDHDVAQLDHGRNICAKFELFSVYSDRDLARTKFYVIFRRILMFKITGSRSKVEPESDHDVALDHGRNICAKFELLPAYGHRQSGSRHPPAQSARPPS